MTFLKRVDPYIELMRRIIELFRPKFYNRLTWVVVISGLLLIGSPWWADLVTAVVSSYFGISLPNTEPHFGWGFGLVLSGLAYHAFVHYVGELVNEGRQMLDLIARREHDRRNFESFRRLMSEEDLGWFFSSLLNDHAYYSESAQKLDFALQHLMAPATQFIDNELVEAGVQLGASLKSLADWISLNFWVVGALGKNGSRYCLFPSGNDDRAERTPTTAQVKRYDELTHQLHEMVKDSSAKYNEFRGAIKRVLAV